MNTDTQTAPNEITTTEKQTIDGLFQKVAALKAELESTKKEKWELVEDANTTIKQLQTSKAELLELLHEINNRYVTLMTGKMQKKLTTILKQHEKNRDSQQAAIN